jgi:hypothetical protein
VKSSGAQVWEQLFEVPQITDDLARDGYFRVTSAQLNSFSKPRGGPDARNLVKFDTSDRLPPSLKSRSLSFLPVARGVFLVGPFRTYLDTPEEESRRVPVQRISFVNTLETLEQNEINSESTALMIAQSSGMMSQFLGYESVHTGFGKSSTANFSFCADREGLNPLNINVDSSTPMELDGVYETAKAIALVEAKNVRSRDFHVRQLYYPMRTLQARYNKPLRNLLVSQHGGIFEFREVAFRDPLNISSFETVRLARYDLSSDRFTRGDLDQICRQEPLAVVPLDVSFPQADKFEKVLFVIERLLEGPLGRDDIANLFGYVPRQGDYYARAGMYLRLVRKEGGLFYATKKAQEVFDRVGADRTRELARILLTVRTIRQALLISVSSGALAKKEQVIALMRDHGEARSINPTTEARRAKTALDWVDWILANTETNG